MRHVHSTLALCLLLAACGRHPAPAPAAVTAKPAPKPAATAPAPAAVLRVSGLTVGSRLDANYAVVAPGHFFDAGSGTLYASVATTAHGHAAVLTAHWHYLEGGDTAFNDNSQTLPPGGAAVTAFKVSNPDHWPAGKYRVEITVDGQPAAQQDFVITGR